MRQTLIGLLTAGLAALALAGSLLLTFAEGGFPAATQVAGIGAAATLFLNPPSTPPASPPAPQATPEIPPPAADSSPTPAQAAPAPTEAIPPATVAPPPPTAAVAAPVILPTVCGPQAGWVAIVVQRGDTLYKIALRSGVTMADLQQANCLITTDLLAGDTLYVPPGAVPGVATASVVNPPCAAHPGWVSYTVQRGDNLFRLSLRYGVSQSALQAANCLGSAARIDVGQVLYVPPGVIATPVLSEAEGSVVPPTPAPEAAQPLVIQYVETQSIRRDSAVPGGAIVTVRVVFSGGAAPFSFYDEGLPQPGNPYDLASTCGGTLVHTARVDSGDGQSASKAYFIPVGCPP